MAVNQYAIACGHAVSAERETPQTALTDALRRVAAWDAAHAECEAQRERNPLAPEVAPEVSLRACVTASEAATACIALVRTHGEAMERLVEAARQVSGWLAFGAGARPHDELVEVEVGALYAHKMILRAALAEMEKP